LTVTILRSGRKRLTTSLHTTRGAIDLASIMVGVLVLGIIAGVIAIAVFAVIPWAQNEAAKGDIESVRVAEAVYKASNGVFADEETLYESAAFSAASGGGLDGGVAAMARAALTEEPPLLERGSRVLDIELVGDGYIVSVVSETGTTFYGSSGNAKILETRPSLDGTPATPADPTPPPVATKIMKFTIDTRPQATGEFALPIAGVAAGASVAWGDGTTEAITSDYQLHTYPASGAYEVTVDGQFNRFGDDGGWVGGPSNDIVTSVSRWDEGTGVTSLKSAFAGSKITAVVAPPSTVTTMSQMFSFALSFNDELTGWDTENVTDMSGMFEVTHFNQSVSALDTSNVVNMSRMFSSAYDFNQTVGLDTRKVTDMSAMFAQAWAFDQKLPETFDTGGVTNMNSMFFDTKVFNQLLPASFDTSDVTDMGQMFSRTLVFDQKLPASFDTGNVTSMEKMFFAAKKFDQDLSGWNVVNVGATYWEFAGESVLSPGNMPHWAAATPVQIPAAPVEYE
jgi:surface protein